MLSRRGRSGRSRCNVTFAQFPEPHSETAPIRRYPVIAVQLRLLRTIAPVEVLVGPKGRRALQLLIVDIEFVGAESRIIGETPPRQRKQVGAHAEEAAETKDRV